MEKLSKVMGHSSVTTTERYAHLRPDLFAAADHRLIAIDLSPAGKLVPLRPEKGAVGYAVSTQVEEVQAKSNARA